MTATRRERAGPRARGVTCSARCRRRPGLDRSDGHGDDLRACAGLQRRCRIWVPTLTSSDRRRRGETRMVSPMPGTAGREGHRRLDRALEAGPGLGDARCNGQSPRAESSWWSADIMTTGSLCLTEILKSWKSCSSNRLASRRRADSTGCSVRGLPCGASGRGSELTRRWQPCDPGHAAAFACAALPAASPATPCRQRLRMFARSFARGPRRSRRRSRRRRTRAGSGCRR